MDGNKDEALKCFKIATDALNSGDRTRALKFINKARRLDPSLPIDDLLSKIDDKPTKDQDPSPAKSPENGSSGVRRRVPATGSEEQVKIVREIKKKKDYYEILGLERSCTVDDVRKAYRKLSLKVHPDKNQAPGAEEAFKAVSKAFQCLSDEESRKKYDVSGSDEQQPVYERRRGGQSFNGFYDNDVDAEEIFRNFFFGGMRPTTTTQFNTFSFGPGVGVRVGTNNNGGGSGGFGRTLIQLLPVILILLVNFLPSSQPVYTLSRQYPYEYRFATRNDVNFYVKSAQFEQDYPPHSHERVNLERQVERDYVSIVSQNCRQELQRFNWGFEKETPHCDMLKQYREKIV